MSGIEKQGDVTGDGRPVERRVIGQDHRDIRLHVDTVVVVHDQVRNQLDALLQHRIDSDDIRAFRPQLAEHRERRTLSPV